MIDAILIQEGGIQTPPPSNENSTFLNLRIKITKNRHQTLLVNRIISWGPFWKMFWIRLCLYGIFLKIDSRYTLFFYRDDETFFFAGGGGYILFCPSLEEDDNFARTYSTYIVIVNTQK